MISVKFHTTSYCVWALRTFKRGVLGSKNSTFFKSGQIYNIYIYIYLVLTGWRGSSSSPILWCDKYKLFGRVYFIDIIYIYTCIYIYYNSLNGIGLWTLGNLFLNVVKSNRIWIVVTLCGLICAANGILFCDWFQSIGINRSCAKGSIF